MGVGVTGNVLFKPGMVYRFGPFELDPHTHELRKRGIRIRLGKQACRVLALTVARQGECVTREALREDLWPGQNFGEFDHRLNQTINRIRSALGDSSARPMYLETVPGVGYRFLAPAQLAELPPASVVPAPVQSPAASRRRFPAAAALGSVAVIVCVGMAILYASRRAPTQKLLDPAPLTFNTGAEGDPSFSPGGEELAYSWKDVSRKSAAIYLRNLRTGATTRLTDAPRSDSSPAWSPDAKYIAFIRKTAENKADLLLLPAMGGPSRKLAQIAWPLALPPGQLSWTADSRWIVVSDAPDGVQSSLYLVSAGDGERRRITVPPAGSNGDAFPAVSRDGSTIAFVRSINSKEDALFLQPLAPGRTGNGPLCVSNLKMRISGVTWALGDSQIVFSAGGWIGQHFLYRVRPAAGAIPADLAAVRIEGSRPVLNPGGHTLAYMRRVFRSSVWRMDVDHGPGTANPIIMSVADDRQPQFSPDGNFIAFSSNRRRNREVWLARADGSEQKCLIPMNVSGATNPRWSPDGKCIAFESRRDGLFDVFLYELATGAVRKLTDGIGENTRATWSRDGRFVYFCSTRGGSPQIWKARREGGGLTMVVRNGGGFAIESPDGKDLYYKTGGISTLHKLSLADDSERELPIVVATDPGFDVTARGIYYLRPNDAGDSGIFYFDFASRSSRGLIRLDHTPANGFSISPVGRHILFTQSDEDRSTLMAINDVSF